MNKNFDCSRFIYNYHINKKKNNYKLNKKILSLKDIKHVKSF
ncbi:MAG: helix-turn-helix domain-containing protein [Bacilli bacterium]|nr:helix-turn-helix domain-containing protein [Bacilli bacterium]